MMAGRLLLELPTTPVAPDLPTLPWPRQAEDGTPLGIDLGKPRKPGAPPAALEVAKLVGASLRGRAVPLDPDDVVQEVCLAIVRRNHCESAFDPRRAGFSKYVWTVAGNVVGHMLDAQRSRKRERVEEDVPELEDGRDPIGAFEDVDAARARGVNVELARRSIEAPAEQLDMFGKGGGR